MDAMKPIVGQPHRLGIYGGTFAPPHNGHIRAAQTFLRQLDLDELLIIPDAIPPHKKPEPGDCALTRLAMARAAFEGLDPRIAVSDYEICRGGASYTYQTLTHFSETTDSELYFLCGTDMFLSIPTWRFPEILFAKAMMVCALRTDDEEARRAVREAQNYYREHYGARTMLMESEPVPVSSTEIRARLRRGENVSDCVPAAVVRLIEEYGLYRA